VAALYGAWRNRPIGVALGAMAAGQALFVAGDLLWNWCEAIGEESFPSMADVLISRATRSSRSPSC
jgi:hypothetical protein